MVIASLAGNIEHGFGQLTPQAKATKSLAHEQALHLSGIGVVRVVKRTQCAAARNAAIHASQQNLSTGRSIFAREGGEFGFESLKFQVDVQAVRILLKDLAHSTYFLQAGRQQVHGRLVHGN